MSFFIGVWRLCALLLLGFPIGPENAEKKLVDGKKIEGVVVQLLLIACYSIYMMRLVCKSFCLL